MAVNYYQEPPSFQQDAVPTEFGWRHPVTNELLVSVRLDPDFIENYGNSVEEEVTEETTQEQATSESKPRRKKKEA